MIGGRDFSLHYTSVPGFCLIPILCQERSEYVCAKHELSFHSNSEGIDQTGRTGFLAAVHFIKADKAIIIHLLLVILLLFCE